jgi:hypothetical protein
MMDDDERRAHKQELAKIGCDGLMTVKWPQKRRKVA